MVVTSMTVGTLATLVLIYVSPTIQMDILGHASAWFPLKNPALVTMPLSFVAGILVSLMHPEGKAHQAYTEVERRMHLGMKSEE
jgi:cation/acetate symporter